MTTIGTFTRDANGSFRGVIQTLNLRGQVRIAKVDRVSERAPDYHVFTGPVQLGAAWSKIGTESQREYLSVKIDDPALPAAIYARLVEREGADYELIWERPVSAEAIAG